MEGNEGAPGRGVSGRRAQRRGRCASPAPVPGRRVERWTRPSRQAPVLVTRSTSTGLVAPRVDPHRERARRHHPVLHRVLDQRMEHQRRHELDRRARGRRRSPRTAGLRSESPRCRDSCAPPPAPRASGTAVAMLAEHRIAQELGERRDHPPRPRGVLVHQRANGVERVEQEVRVELVAQRVEPRLLRERARLERAGVRRFEIARPLHAEVERAPGKDRERVVERLTRRA